MNNKKNIFRNVFDAMVEGRTRSAQREIAQYRKMLRVKPSDLA